MTDMEFNQFPYMLGNEVHKTLKYAYSLKTLEKNSFYVFETSFLFSTFFVVFFLSFCFLTE